MPQIFILSGTTTWTVPDDCVSVNVDTIGAGAGGDSVGGAGGGGAWSSIVGLAVTPKSTIAVQVGAGGSTGSVGGDTWFNGASLAAASVGAKGGGAPTTTTGGTGGQASGRPNSGNTSGNNGGNGGSVASANPGGGGGAAGPNGNGVAGSNGGVSLGGSGGAGDNGSGGSGGAGSASGTNPGNPGTEYDGSHGSGGGGGGSITAAAGAGGNYGGGGGGSLVTGGAGANGLIVINYVSAFVNKRTTAAPWNVSLEDPSVWQGSPIAYNQSLATTIFPKSQLRPPFVVPRPSDDFVWYPTLDNRNSNVLDAFIAVQFFGAGGQAPTKRWLPQYLYDTAEPNNWSPTPNNLNANTIDLLTHVKFFGAGGQAPTPRWNKFYDYNVGEPEVWRGPLDNYNSNSIPLLTAVKFFGAGGQAPTKRWGPYYNYDVAESGWQEFNWMGTAIFYTLLNGPKSPFKLPTWKFGYDDPSFWTGFPIPARSLNLPVILPQSVFYLPRPSDDFLWSPTARNSNLIIELTVGGVVKFQREWLFGYDDPAFRSDLGPKASGVIPFATVGGQVKPRLLWSYTTDDLPAWLQPPLNNLSLSTTPIAKNVLRPPFVVPRPSDDTYWQFGSIGENLALNVVPSHNPFVYIPWKFGYDDSNGWQYQTPYNLNAAASIQFPPELDWTYSAPDDFPGWQAALGQKNINLTPGVVNTPFTYIPWKFGYDDSSGWQGRPLASELLIPVTTAGGQIEWKREWLFGYDDPAFRADLGPQSSKLLLPILVNVGQVKFKREWLFGYDDPAFWRSSPIGNFLALTTIPQPEPFFNLKQWLFSYDDHSYWVFDPQPSRILTPSVGQIKFQREWLFGYDDPAFRSDLGPQSSKILAPILTAGGQTKSKQWLFGYDDPPFWSPILGRQMQLLSLPKAVPFLPPTPTFIYDDPAFWQYGYYARSNFPLIILPLIVDYNYICSPNASIPSNAGARRTFTTSPNASVPTNAGAARTFVTSPLTPNPMKKLF